MAPVRSWATVWRLRAPARTNGRTSRVWTFAAVVYTALLCSAMTPAAAGAASVAAAAAPEATFKVESAPASIGRQLGEGQVTGALRVSGVPRKHGKGKGVCAHMLSFDRTRLWASGRRRPRL